MIRHGAPLLLKERHSCSWSQSSPCIVSPQPSKWKHQIEPLFTLTSTSQSFAGKCRGRPQLIIHDQCYEILNPFSCLPLFADFDDMSCQMIFGQEPPKDDPAFKQPCYKLCNCLTHKSSLSLHLYFTSRVVNPFLLCYTKFMQAKQTKVTLWDAPSDHKEKWCKEGLDMTPELNQTGLYIHMHLISQALEGWMGFCIILISYQINMF